MPRGARKAAQQGIIALEISLRGLLRHFGLKVGAISRDQFENRIREMAELERRVRQFAQHDSVCHRLMPMLGIGAVVELLLCRRRSWPIHIVENRLALGSA